MMGDRTHTYFVRMNIYMLCLLGEMCWFGLFKGIYDQSLNWYTISMLIVVAQVLIAEFLYYRMDSFFKVKIESFYTALWLSGLVLSFGFIVIPIIGYQALKQNGYDD